MTCFPATTALATTAGLEVTLIRLVIDELKWAYWGRRAALGEETTTPALTLSSRDDGTVAAVVVRC